jgi:hypothetical protein
MGVVKDGEGKTGERKKRLKAKVNAGAVRT